MKKIPTLLAGLLLALGLATTDSAAAAKQPAPIHFGAIGWESGALTTEILRFIVEHGYGYPTDTLPGSTVSMEVALARNDLQVIAEEWAGRSPAWVKAEQAGQVFALGDTVKNAEEGWWVPAYVIKGDAARNLKALAPDLHHVADLKRYPEVFKDPEAPARAASSTAPAAGPPRPSTARNSRPMVLTACTTISAAAPAPPSMPRSRRRSAWASRCCSTTGARPH